MQPQVERELIPSLREGVDVVKMVVFRELKDDLVRRYPGEQAGYYGKLAAALLNELFDTPNPREEFQCFVRDNQGRVEESLRLLTHAFPELCIVLTDALRIHFLCNFQEGVDAGNEEMLARARKWGILQEERDVPLPKGFMELVYRLGRAKGLIVSQSN